MLLLTKIRKEQNLSAVKLATKAHMHASSICQIEKCKLQPYPSQIEKIALALNWKKDPYILCRKVKETNEK